MSPLYRAAFQPIQLGVPLALLLGITLAPKLRANYFTPAPPSGQPVVPTGPSCCINHDSHSTASLLLVKSHLVKPENPSAFVTISLGRLILASANGGHPRLNLKATT